MHSERQELYMLQQKVDNDVFTLVRLIGARNKCPLSGLTGVSILSRLNLEKM